MRTAICRQARNQSRGDDDSYNFYFITKNGKNGQGQMGEKDNYLYFGGKRLEADDDYKIYFLDGEYYLVNNKGKIQEFQVQEVRCGEWKRHDRR